MAHDGQVGALQRRLAWVLGKQEIQVEAEGVRLCAWLSENLDLAVSVTVTGPWNRQIEEELCASLKRSRRLTAMLVLAEWHDIRALCERQGRGAKRTMN